MVGKLPIRKKNALNCLIASPDTRNEREGIHMMLPEKLSYAHSAISAVFAFALIRHYRLGNKDPSIKSRFLISVLLGMSVLAIAIGALWPEYHS